MLMLLIGIKGCIGIWTHRELNRTKDIFQVTIFPVIDKIKTHMKEAATICFADLETNQEALVIVRYNESCVVVALSHRDDGDLQVVMSKKNAQHLREALDIALTSS